MKKFTVSVEKRVTVSYECELEMEAEDEDGAVDKFYDIAGNPDLWDEIGLNTKEWDKSGEDEEYEILSLQPKDEEFDDDKDERIQEEIDVLLFKTNGGKENEQSIHE